MLIVEKVLTAAYRSGDRLAKLALADLHEERGNVEKAAMLRRPTRGYGVTAEDFVIAWQTSHTVREVAGRLRMWAPSVRSRAVFYRKSGIWLKSFGR